MAKKAKYHTNFKGLMVSFYLKYQLNKNIYYYRVNCVMKTKVCCKKYLTFMSTCSVVSVPWYNIFPEDCVALDILLPTHCNNDVHNVLGSVCVPQGTRGTSVYRLHSVR